MECRRIGKKTERVEALGKLRFFESTLYLNEFAVDTGEKLPVFRQHVDAGVRDNLTWLGIYTICSSVASSASSANPLPREELPLLTQLEK
jgi:hypothetical protein